LPTAVSFQIDVPLRGKVRSIRRHWPICHRRPPWEPAVPSAAARGPRQPRKSRRTRVSWTSSGVRPATPVSWRPPNP